MLKRDPTAKFLYRKVGFFHRKKLYRFQAGKLQAVGEWEEENYRRLLEVQKTLPIDVWRYDANKRQWWMFNDEFYWEDDGYTKDEVKALILDKQAQKEKRVNRAVARISQTESEAENLRESIPDDVKLFVWQRDGGKCVKCGIQQNLEFDHIIPVAKGGSNTARNIQLLCETCNRSKGANLF